MIRLPEEVPRFRIDNGHRTHCVARAIRSCHFEIAPILESPMVSVHSDLLTIWDQSALRRDYEHGEVYTDGSMRFSNLWQTYELSNHDPFGPDDLSLLRQQLEHATL